MTINPVLSKLVSEGFLSLYPIFIRKIPLDLDIQMWTRLIAFVLISIFFINYSYVTNTLLSYEGMALSIVNMAHIYSSYEGFDNLDSGISFSIFNIYPLLILLLSGVLWTPAYIYAILALILFIYSNYSKIDSKKDDSSFRYGMIMIILAALTEAIMYFLVKNLPTDNNWNHVFIAYFMGSILMTIYIVKSNKFENINLNSSWIIVIIGLLINAVIGCLGYYLRFNSISNLDTGTYATLSYTGIIMAYLYGILFNDEQVTIYSIIAPMLIIYSNYLIR
jgi:drug/metabolite transporter (DMT)-like permease